MKDLQSIIIPGLFALINVLFMFIVSQKQKQTDRHEEEIKDLKDGLSQKDLDIANAKLDYTEKLHETQDIISSGNKELRDFLNAKIDLFSESILKKFDKVELSIAEVDKNLNHRLEENTKALSTEIRKTEAHIVRIENAVSLRITTIEKDFIKLTAEHSAFHKP